MIRAVDADGSGTIDLEEFTGIMAVMFVMNKQEQVRPVSLQHFSYRSTAFWPHHLSPCPCHCRIPLAVSAAAVSRLIAFRRAGRGLGRRGGRPPLGRRDRGGAHVRVRAVRPVPRLPRGDEVSTPQAHEPTFSIFLFFKHRHPTPSARSPCVPPPPAPTPPRCRWDGAKQLASMPALRTGYRIIGQMEGNASLSDKHVTVTLHTRPLVVNENL